MTAPSPNRLLCDKTSLLPDGLHAYLQNKFVGKETGSLPVFSDEPYVAAWTTYLENNHPTEAIHLLQKCYPQFNFPVRDGMNKTQAYIDAVLKGKPAIADSEPLLNRPERLQLQLHNSIAGIVPVLIIPDNQDFVRVVQCLLHKNNPQPVPASMGASLVNGINNWDRIQALKKNWLQTNSAETWPREFSANILPHPDLYKDKLILLSTKPYSNVLADRLGLAEDVWARYSLSIRLEHECTHLYTLRRFGCASNNLHDELIADYIGICKTAGSYRKDWMLAFMGLEDYPDYRKGARLENYLAETNLTAGNFGQLTTILWGAIKSITRFDAALGPIRSPQDQMCRIDALCLTDLAAIASGNGADLLLQQYSAVIQANTGRQL